MASDMGEILLWLLPRQEMGEVLLWLPPTMVICAARVCRTWHEIVWSAWFRDRYEGRAYVVQHTLTSTGAKRFAVIDADGDGSSVIHVRRDIFFGRLFCPKYAVACSATTGVLYVWTRQNVWEAVPSPLPPGRRLDIHRLAVFDLGSRHYRLVLWNSYGSILTLERGQQEWRVVREPKPGGGDMLYPVVLGGDRLLSIDFDDCTVMVYTPGSGGVAASLLTSSDEEFNMLDVHDAFVYGGRVYLLTLVEDEDVGPVYLSFAVWKVGVVADGHPVAYPVARYQLEEEPLGCVRYRTSDRGTKLVLDVSTPDNERSLVFDFATASVEKIPLVRVARSFIPDRDD